MSARTDLENLYAQMFADLNNSPAQQLNALQGAEEYNLNIANTHNRYFREALLILADRIDALEH